MSRVYPVILNPIAGGGRLLRQRPKLDEAARQMGVQLLWWPTQEAGHGEELARQAVAAGHTMVFAFGGDGTYNEVGRGLLGSATAMAPLPGGTTSVLAYEFGIVRPAHRALKQLLDGQIHDMHVGQTDHGEIFLLMLSAGPDTLVLSSLGARLKKLGGRVGVGVQAMVEFVGGAAMPAVKVEMGDESRTAGWVIVGNSRCYAGPFHATPGADPHAPSLEVVAQHSRGRRAALGFVLGIARQRHLRRPDVNSTIVNEVFLESTSPDDDAWYQIDGDLAGKLPVRAGIAADTLRICVPSNS
ncbi:MAG: hypothetical protein GY906_28640 [bacterium]|nr:hypothetical protein [bacterium]